MPLYTEKSLWYNDLNTVNCRRYPERRTIMSSKIKDEKLDFLFQAILTLETVDDCYSFFEDLCTVSELQEMSRRMEAARMLRANAVYADIAAKTGLSTATISRVNRCLKYGSDGYNKALDDLEASRHPGVRDRRRS